MSVVVSVIESPAGPKASRHRHLHVVPAIDESERHSSAATARRTGVRRLVALLALVVVALGAVLAGRAMASPETSSTPRVVVQEGETLSQIAARQMPGVSNAQAVVQIERANGLSSAHVDTGQEVIIPAR